jgi:hypothetical protein
MTFLQGGLIPLTKEDVVAINLIDLAETIRVNPIDLDHRTASRTRSLQNSNSVNLRFLTQFTLLSWKYSVESCSTEFNVSFDMLFPPLVLPLTAVVQMDATSLSLFFILSSFYSSQTTRMSALLNGKPNRVGCMARAQTPVQAFLRPAMWIPGLRAVHAHWQT